MKFRHELPYEASAAKVYAMLADPAFREAVCDAQDVVEVDVQITSQGQGMQVTVDQVQRTPVPAFARKVIGETTHAVQREEWADHRSATLVIETPGMPASVRGGITIESTGRSAMEVVQLDIKSSIPLIGGRLEKLMADLIRRAVVTEHQTGIAWLAGDRP